MCCSYHIRYPCRDCVFRGLLCEGFIRSVDHCSDFVGVQVPAGYEWDSDEDDGRW